MKNRRVNFSEKVATFVTMLLLLCGWSFAQQTQLELWTFIDPESDNVRSRALAYVIETFEAENPDVEIVTNVLNWQEINPTLLRAVQARQAPDVVMLFAPLIPTQIAAGSLTPLGEYFATWSEEDRNDLVMFPEARDGDGEIYAVPYEMRVAGFVYNTSLFEEAGVGEPKSLQELAEITSSIHQKTGKVGIALGFSSKNPSGAMEWLFPTLVGLGVDVLNEDGTAAFGEPESEHLVQWVYDLVHEHNALPLDVAMMGSEETQQLVISGEAAMEPKATHRLSFMQEQSGLGDTLQMMRLVTFDENEPGPALVQGWALAVPSGTSNAEDAWSFIEHWISTDVQVEQAKIAGYIPIRTSALEDPYFQEEEAATIRWAIEYASEHPMDFVFPENTNVLYDVWARMFERVLNNQMSPREGLEWAEAEYNRLIQ